MHAKSVSPITYVLAGLLSMTAAGCGHDNAMDGAGVSPTAPSPPQQNASSPRTILIAEINGPNSFYPSPVTIQPGQPVIWRNGDSATHHLVFDDGAIDTGTLAPGTLSQPQTVAGQGGSYHCTIHPSMVGSITVTAPW
jgi:plastocyanin